MERPVWISHRGYKQNHLENTLGAFRSARALGFEWLETDLRITSDSHIVLSHDRDLTRVYGNPRTIASASRKELAAISSPSGDSLLFLDQFMEEFSNCQWVFDVKREQGTQTLSRLISWAKAARFEKRLVEQTTFLLWTRPHEKLLRELLPAARLYAGKKQCWRAGLAVLAGMAPLGTIEPAKTYSLPPQVGIFPLYRHRIASRYHQRNARVLAFLPKKDEQTRQAMKAGFDEILTDGRILT